MMLANLVDNELAYQKRLRGHLSYGRHDSTTRNAALGDSRDKEVVYWDAVAGSMYRHARVRGYGLLSELIENCARITTG